MVLCGAVALGAYALTLSPTVAGEDSGELNAAAYVLGVPQLPDLPGGIEPRVPIPNLPGVPGPPRSPRS